MFCFAVLQKVRYDTQGFDALCSKLSYEVSLTVATAKNWVGEQSAYGDLSPNDEPVG